MWGTRGSLGVAGHRTVDYGGNTACVQVTSDDGGLLVLDAGSGRAGWATNWLGGRKYTCC